MGNHVSQSYHPALDRGVVEMNLLHICSPPYSCQQSLVSTCELNNNYFIKEMTLNKVSHRFSRCAVGLFQTRSVGLNRKGNPLQRWSFNKWVFASLVVSCLLLSSNAFAAYPLFTDDAGTTGSMKFQVETSAEFGWDKENEHGLTETSSYQRLNVAVTAGILDTLDLSACYPYTWQKIEDSSGNRLDNSGLNDLSLALKWRFLEIGPVSLAIKPAITFPSGNRDRSLGAGQAAYGATLISTVEFKPLTIHGNIGYTRQKYTDADKDGSRENLWNVSLAGTVEIMKGLQVVVEVGAASDPDKSGTTWPAFMAGGLIYAAGDHLDLSLGVKGGVNAPATDIALLTGITVKIP